VSAIVRIIAPTGRDAELITNVLQHNKVSAEPSSFDRLRLDHSAKDPIGPLLIAEEALHTADVGRLGTFLSTQPSWSDVPILILTGTGRETLQNSLLHREHSALGSPVLLERPIRTATLVSSVKAAVRARNRQYQVRDVVAELQEERETLEAMLDNLPVGVILAKASGEILRGNRRLEEVLRHPLLKSADIEEHGEWVAFRADGTRVKGAEFPLPRAMKAGHSLPAEEYLYQRGDGTKAWVSLAASPIMNAQGEVTGGVVSVSDVDQQRRSEAALIQNEKLAAVGRLAASISHEINNPLEAVTNLLYLARHTEKLPEEVDAFLESADRELTRVSQIVSHTLRFHRQSTRPRAISAKELLEPTLGLYATRLLNAGIHLEQRERSSQLATCLEGEIRQVLNNLVGNAIDAMKTGGRLLIRTADSHHWQDGVPGVRITIADTGHGMSRDVAQRVFEAFYTTKGINGTGLGLWISHGIMEKNAGDLKLRSSNKEGKSGTTFMLFIPLRPPTALHSTQAVAGSV
jgi:PAS domain S-box-containing protein